MTRVKFLSVLSCVLLASSCASGSTNLFDPRRHDLIDQELGLSRNDYNNITNLNSYKEGEAGKTGGAHPPAIPDIAEILAAPTPPKIGATQLVSISVTDDVPLKDVLMQLARLANVNMEVDAGITGGVDFRAKDEPFNQVIEQISNLAGLRYSMKNNVVRVERDTPYVQVYSLDFLNLDRSAQSNVNISTSVLSSSGVSGGGSGGSGGTGGSGGGNSGSSGGGSGGLDNGSSSTITSKADSDFWKQFEEGVKKIINYQEPSRVSDVSVAAQPNAPAAGGTTPANASTTAPAAAASPPVAAPAASGTSSTPASGSDSDADKAFFVLNRQAGTLTVNATQRQQDLIKEFIRRLQANASAQVLIEAKIVEVTLDNEFQSGIDWTKLGSHKINFVSQFAPVAPDTNNVATFTLNPGADLNSAVKLAQLFGTTRTLASPRLHAINNQEAVMTFAQNQVYFTITATQNESAAPSGASTGINTLTLTSTAHTVPIGIIMSVQPSIDTSDNEITLSIRPTLSRVTGSVTDPAIAFVLAQAAAQGVDTTGITATLPIIEVRELDSILKVKSGQVMVIGGLMQDVGNNSENGLPGVSEIPWIGNLFKGVDKKSNVSELVIFIRATVVGPNGDAAPADRDFYHKFTRDPRPLTF